MFRVQSRKYSAKWVKWFIWYIWGIWVKWHLPQIHHFPQLTPLSGTIAAGTLPKGGSTILRRCEVPIFAMPNIPAWQALILMAVVILIMVFFPPLLSQIIFGALMLYILYRVVTNYD